MSPGDICLEGALAETRHQTDDDEITRSRDVHLYTSKNGERQSTEVHHFDLEDDGYPATLSVMVDGKPRERNLCKGRLSAIQAGAPGLSDRELVWGDDPKVMQTEDARIMAGDLILKHSEHAAVAADGQASDFGSIF